MKTRIEKINEELRKGTDTEKNDVLVVASYWSKFCEMATPDQFCELLVARPSGEITQVGAELGGPTLGLDA